MSRHSRRSGLCGLQPSATLLPFATALGRGLQLGEVVCAPGVDNLELLEAVFKADLAAFGAQAPQLAERYRTRSPVLHATRIPVPGLLHGPQAHSKHLRKSTRLVRHSLLTATETSIAQPKARRLDAGRVS
jgi:hypothetical protein